MRFPIDVLNKLKDFVLRRKPGFFFLPISPVPEFCIGVRDNSLAHRMDMRSGDLILCDRRNLTSALYVVAEYGGEFRVCTQLPGGRLFDEQTQKEAPENAKVFGRIVYVLRRWMPEEAKP